MVLPPSLHLGRGLPSDEPRVDLLEELRVEDTLGGDLLGDPVERVEEVDELAHAEVDLVGHLHRVDVEGHDVAREPFVHLHLTRHDLHGGLAVGVDRGRRLRERAQHRLQGVRVLLEHLAARDDPRVHEEPVDLTLLARDVAPVPGEVDLSPRALDGVEHPRRPARHRVDVPLASAVTPSGGARFTNWILAKSTPVSFAIAWMAMVTDAPFGMPTFSFSRSLGDRTIS